jgi:hypothetical protein
MSLMEVYLALKATFLGGLALVFLFAPRLHAAGAGYADTDDALEGKARTFVRGLQRELWGLVLLQAVLVGGALSSGDLDTQLFITAAMFANDLVGLTFDLRAATRASGSQLAVRLAWMAFAVITAVVSIRT